MDTVSSQVEENENDNTNTDEVFTGSFLLENQNKSPIILAQSDDVHKNQALQSSVAKSMDFASNSRDRPFTESNDAS